jgi:multiple sugar transport system substrate-binding protein
VTLARFCPLWLVLVTLMTAACGSAGSGTSQPPSGPMPTVTVPFEMPVVVTIAGTFTLDELPILEEQIAIFEAANPDIVIEINTAPRDEAERRERFATQLDGGDTSRDILLLHTTWLAEFAAAGWLVPIEDYARAEQVAIHDFWPASIQAATVDGQWVALPWVADGGLLYYRQDLLEKHGYDPPSTWADLQRIALEVSAKEGLTYGYVWQGAAYETLTCNALEFVWAYGGDVLDGTGNAVFDSPASRAALQQMIDLIGLGASPPEVTTYQETATLAAFEEGHAVFMRNWAYAWDRLQATGSPLAGRVGLAPLPVSCLGGEALALSALSQHPEQAFRFMAFLVGYDQQVQVARQGLQPPALETVYSDAGLLADAPVFEALRAALSATRPRPRSPVYPEISAIIYTEVNSMLRGEQSAEATATEVQRRLRALPQQ